jgi:CDP-glycerol glycerophosphotransferase (TagB/SpsB family)
MVSNQLKAYDRVFTAGRAARERILATLPEFDARAFVDVGRPQMDIHDEVPHLPPSDRTTVLYAPTWEGDSRAMSYSSLVSQGERIARTVLKSPRHRLLYRPHPQTGTISPETRSADLAVRAQIRAANSADPSAGHLIDTDPPFGWQLHEADQCICDVSAVAFDWLATGKPLVLTDAHGDAASAGPTTSKLTQLHEQWTEHVLEILERETDEEHRARMAALVEYHFGDTTPGASLSRFVTACVTAVRERRALLGEAT